MAHINPSPVQSGTYVTRVAAPTGVAATDTANLQAALTAGGLVALDQGGGTYVTNATLTASKARTVIEGNGCTIQPAAGVGRTTDILAVTATEVALRGLRTDGTNGGGTGVHVTANRVRITECTIIESGQYGIFLDTGSGVTFIRGNRIQNTAVGATSHGILVTQADHHILDNDIGGFGSGVGIACSGAAAVLIAGNQIYSCQSGVSLYLPYRVRVVGNQLEQNTQHGVVVNADTAGTWGQTVITGNNIWESGFGSAAGTYHGITVLGTVNMPGLVIVGNTSVDDRGGSATAGYGVNINNAALSRCLVEGNVLLPNFSGAMNVAAAAAGGVRAVGNSGYNPQSHSVTQPAVPASTVTATNNSPVDCTVYVAGGTVSAIAVDGVATGLGASPAIVRVPAGSTIALTYTVAPTWQWFGD